MRQPSLTALAVLGALLAGQAIADPPSWAPAHGYRDKHGDDDGHKGRSHRHDRRGRADYYVGYSGREYDRDFEIVRGRCNREQVGAVLGGVVGGVVGNQVADRDDRTVATILGAAVGALVGAKIGRDMDDRDRACLGQSLELGAAGQRITWSNASTGMRYELQPGDGRRDGAGPVCRDFRLVTVRGQDRVVRDGRACQVGPGVWDTARG